MAPASELDNLNVYLRAYLQQTVVALMTVEEKSTYEINFGGRVHYNLGWFSLLVDAWAQFDHIDNPGIVEAMVGQALVGRAAMMKEHWFQELYKDHGWRLDRVPRRPPPGLKKFRDAILGRTDGYELPRRPANAARTPDEQLALLRSKVAEMNDFEKEADKDINELVDGLGASHPGLRGVIWEVRRGFLYNPDRGAERTALMDAITEYMEES